MSWWISLVKDERKVQVSSHVEGGVINVDGEDEATMSVTYNYAPLFANALGCGMRDMNGVSGADSMPILEAGVTKLGTERSDNYWDATYGNAGQVLAVMLDWAKAHPDAVWQVH